MENLIGEVIGGLGSAVAGVATGGLFSVVSALFKGVGGYLKRKQEIAARKAEWEHEKDLLRLEMERDDKDTENEIEIEDTRGSWQGLQASYNTVIASSQVHKWVNDLRSLYRLFLTTFLLVMVWSIFNDLMAILRGNEAALSAAFTPEDAGVTVRYIVHSIVFTACTAAMWWYGDRALTPAEAKQR